MSLRYYYQDGVVPNFNSDIKEIRVNTDFKPLGLLKISADANFRTRYSLEPVGAYDYDNLGGGIFYSMFHATQFVVPRYPDGSYGLGNKTPIHYCLPKWQVIINNGPTVHCNVKAEINIIDGLKFTTSLHNNMLLIKQLISQMPTP